MLKILNGLFYTEEYLNIDTNQKHLLLIYQYSLENASKHQLIIGEVKDKTNVSDVIKYLNKIINCYFNKSLPIFSCSLIKSAKDNAIFEHINFSRKGYSFIFEGNLNEISNNVNLNYENSSEFLKNFDDVIIIDQTTKRLSFIGEEPMFAPISYYEDKTSLNEKEEAKILYMKKIFNY